MNWAHAIYGWGGLNEALFHLINGATPQGLLPLVQFLALAGGYWSAPAVMAGLWLHARTTDDKHHSQSRSLPDSPTNILSRQSTGNPCKLFRFELMD